MYKNFTRLIALFSLVQITLGLLSVFEVIKNIKYLGVYWVVAGIIMLILAISVYRNLKVNNIKFLFILYVILLISLYATCWINIFSLFLIVPYSFLIIPYTLGRIIETKI